MQGTVIDRRYSIIRALGGGGMAMVYLAHDDVLDRDVALKVLRSQFTGDDQFTERFRREARSAAALTHPNIVSVYDRGEADGTAYIAMEYVPGGTLKERISREGPLKPDEATRLALQVSEALGAAHRKGVIHRDIKPHNVLLSDSGDAKVTDFGIARAVSAATISQTSRVMGTASYMSPEQALGEIVDHRTDLYSLGVTLYEMLTGELPHTADSPVAVSMKHVNEAPHPPREFNLSVPEDLNAIVMKLLEKDPENRYRSAHELSQDLRRVREGLAPLAATTPAPTLVNPEPTARPTARAIPAIAPRTRKRRRGLRALLALALVLIAALGLGWVLSQPFQFANTASGVKVPSVKGLSQDQAQRKLQDRGFETAIRKDDSSTKGSGTVLDQSPAAGESAPKGSTVTLTVAGSSTVEVPKVVGLSQDEAESRLRSANLTPVLARQVSSETVPKGVVFEQGYEPGTPVPPGTSVNIGVSTGPPPAPSNNPNQSTATATSSATATATSAAAPAPQSRKQPSKATVRSAQPKAKENPQPEAKPKVQARPGVGKGTPGVRKKIVTDGSKGNPKSGVSGGGPGKSGGGIQSPKGKSGAG